MKCSTCRKPKPEDDGRRTHANCRARVARYDNANRKEITEQKRYMRKLGIWTS